MIYHHISQGNATAVAATQQGEYETLAVVKDAQYQLQQSQNNIAMIAQNNAANQQQCCCQVLLEQSMV